MQQNVVPGQQNIAPVQQNIGPVGTVGIMSTELWVIFCVAIFNNCLNKSGLSTTMVGIVGTVGIVAAAVAVGAVGIVGTLAI